LIALGPDPVPGQFWLAKTLYKISCQRPDLFAERGRPRPLRISLWSATGAPWFSTPSHLGSLHDQASVFDQWPHLVDCDPEERVGSHRWPNLQRVVVQRRLPECRLPPSSAPCGPCWRWCATVTRLQESLLSMRTTIKAGARCPGRCQQFAKYWTITTLASDADHRQRDWRSEITRTLQVPPARPLMQAIWRRGVENLAPKTSSWNGRQPATARHAPPISP